MSDQPQWIANALDAISQAEASVEARLKDFLQHLHNEMAHGGGLTNPQAVTEQAVAAGPEIAAAIQGSAVEEVPLAEPAQDPADDGEVHPVEAGPTDQSTTEV